MAVLLLLPTPAGQHGGRSAHRSAYPQVWVRPGQVSLRCPVVIAPSMERLPTAPLPDPAVLEFVGANRVQAGSCGETTADGATLYLAFRERARGVSTLRVESCQGCTANCDSCREHGAHVIVVAP